MARMKGKIVYYDGKDGVEFKPCERWNSAEKCPFVLGKHKYLTPSERARSIRNSHFTSPADPDGQKSDLLSLGVFLYASNVRLEPMCFAPLCHLPLYYYN